MLTFDVFGNASPHGKTVTYPSPPASIAVTFSTTAVAVLGTPASPAITTGLYEPAVGFAVSRVSKTRSGETPRKAEAPTGAADTTVEPTVETATKDDASKRTATNLRLNIAKG